MTPERTTQRTQRSSFLQAERPPGELVPRSSIRPALRRTPGRPGGLAYRTATQLELQEDHAAAVDAVETELDLARAISAPSSIERWGLFEVATLAADKAEYLARPELGRRA